MKKDYKVKVGDMLFVHYYDIRFHKDEYLQVTKVGKKYFFLGRKGSDFLDKGMRFSMDDFSHCNGAYMPLCELYESEESYRYSIEIQNKKREVQDKLIKYLHDNEVEILYNILNERRNNENKNQ